MRQAIYKDNADTIIGFQSTHPLWDVTNKQRGILFFILSISKQASPTEYGAQNSLQVYENKP